MSQIGDATRASAEASTVREAFEHWYSNEGKYQRAVQRDGEGYVLMQTHTAWLAWQAAWGAATGSAA